MQDKYTNYNLSTVLTLSQRLVKLIQKRTICGHVCDSYNPVTSLI